MYSFRTPGRSVKSISGINDTMRIGYATKTMDTNF